MHPGSIDGETITFREFLWVVLLCGNDVTTLRRIFLVINWIVPLAGTYEFPGLYHGIWGHMIQSWRLLSRTPRRLHERGFLWNITVWCIIYSRLCAKPLAMRKGSIFRWKSWLCRLFELNRKNSTDGRTLSAIFESIIRFSLPLKGIQHQPTSFFVFS